MACSSRRLSSFGMRHPHRDRGEVDDGPCGAGAPRSALISSVRREDPALEVGGRERPRGDVAPPFGVGIERGASYRFEPLRKVAH